MLTHDTMIEIEAHLAEAIAHLAAELRLVDIGDYIAYLRMERFMCVADIVRDAADMFFVPGYIEFDMDGEAAADWGTAPEVTLMLVMRGLRTRAHVALKLCKDHAEVKLGYIDYANGFEVHGDRTGLLAQDIADNTLGRRKRTLPMSEPVSGFRP